jgi:hypothetical protein
MYESSVSGDLQDYPTLWCHETETSPQVMDLQQGCQIFLGTTYQNGGKYAKWPATILNGQKNGSEASHLLEE